MEAHRVILATLGRTASGKTTLAKFLASSLGLYYVPEAAFKRVLRPDYSTEDSLDEDLRDIAYQASIAAAAGIVAKGQTPIIDASFHQRRRRQWLIQMAKDARTGLVFLYCRCNDEEETRRRIMRRKHEPKSHATHADSMSIYVHINSEFQELDETELHQSKLWALLTANTVENSLKYVAVSSSGSRPFEECIGVVHAAVSEYLCGQRERA